MDENDEENKERKENKENKRDFKTSENNEVTVKGKNKMLWEAFLSGKNIMFICFCFCSFYK